MEKLSIRAILSGYLSTLYTNKNGKKRGSFWDIFVQIILPIIVGIALAYAGFNLKNVSSLMSGVAIVSALLGAVSVFLFQTRIQLYEKMNKSFNNGHSRGTIYDEDDICVLDELFFSVIWCIFEGMTICAALIVCGCAGIPEQSSLVQIWTAISSLIVIAGCNLTCVLLMCLKRMTRIYERLGMHKSKESLSR